MISMNSGSDVAADLGALLHVGQSEYDAGVAAGQRLAEMGGTKGICVNQEVGNVALDLDHRVGLHVFADGMALEISDHDLMVDVGRGRPVRHAQGDPVWREDRDFVEAVMGRDNRIRCPDAEALETHRVALAISRACQAERRRNTIAATASDQKTATVSRLIAMKIAPGRIRPAATASMVLTMPLSPTATISATPAQPSMRCSARSPRTISHGCATDSSIHEHRIATWTCVYHG